MDFSQFFRSHLEDVNPYVPGKPVEEVRRERGVDKLEKLASNENFLGTNPASLEAAREMLSCSWIYPDSGCWSLTESLAKKCDLSPDSLIVAGGSVEVLFFLSIASLSKGDEVVSPFPSFAMYPIATRITGARFVGTPLRSDYGYDIDALIGAFTPNTKIVYLANPNNPTGVMTLPDEISRVVSALPPQALLVIDEAYWDLVDHPRYPDGLDWVRNAPNVFVTRSFSKGHGLAGLRVGFGVGHPQLIEGIKKVYPPFNVSSIAQVAALAALEAPEHLERTKEMLRIERPWLTEQIRRAGFDVPDSQTNFICVGVRQDAQSVANSLMDLGYIVRPLKGFGLPQHIRVTVGKRDTNRGFVKALESLEIGATHRMGL
ncbi:histidinol-phosphate transaminase [bacterium]|nr:histidinol-phosphate transaminase [bacterium]